MSTFAELSPAGRKLAVQAGWTEEREKELRRLFDLGLSAGSITASLGLESRNQVIGKIHRLGLTRSFHASAHYRAKGSGMPKPKPAPRIKLKPDDAIDWAAVRLAPRPIPQPKPEPADAQPLRLTIAELRNDSCRWPLGDPSDLATFRYCGAGVDMPGVVPYCSGHCRLAYQPRAA